mmetsp:Transcript_8805/g.22187  ORF Transcript_8805/g.22187 Transcript_8805/m.22187 type:complete len:261 (-) Transcript_8805:313-1095(-)
MTSWFDWQQRRGRKRNTVPWPRLAPPVEIGVVPHAIQVSAYSERQAGDQDRVLLPEEELCEGQVPDLGGSSEQAGSNLRTPLQESQPKSFRHVVHNKNGRRPSAMGVFELVDVGAERAHEGVPEVGTRLESEVGEGVAGLPQLVHRKPPRVERPQHLPPGVAHNVQLLRPPQLQPVHAAHEHVVLPEPAPRHGELGLQGVRRGEEQLGGGGVGGGAGGEELGAVEEVVGGELSCHPLGFLRQMVPLRRRVVLRVRPGRLP